MSFEDEKFEVIAKMVKNLDRTYNAIPPRPSLLTRVSTAIRYWIYRKISGWEFNCND